ncbi:MAG TPA: hypothetical protein VFQ45_16870 [Longimicrobium sp.]|nr:hypothetical protein [Longimicrobium sp.]
MPHRTFTAPDGHAWDVWDVVPPPEAANGHSMRFLPSEMTAGWLCFESEREKRRLYPRPEGWDEMSTADLCALWETAVAVNGRTPTMAAGAPPERRAETQA